MRTHTLTLRSATTAIAAVLALGSTPLLAQAVSPVGEPVIVAPVAAAPAAPVAAAPAAPTTTSDPVVQSLPSTYVPANSAAPEAQPSAAPATAPRAAAPARPAARTASPVAAAAPAMAAPATDTVPAAAPIEQAAAPADPELFPASQTANEPVITPAPAANAVDDFTVVTGVVGGLTILALGWLGFAVTRRRKVRRAQAVPEVTRPVITPRQTEPVVTTRAAAPVIAEKTVSDPAPVMADPQAIPAATPIRAGMEQQPAVARAENAFGAGHARWADDHRPRAAQAKGALPSNGASVDLPARIPDNFEDRDALLKRMIAAEPDKANPYTDRRARMKRARLILQSLGRDFGNAEPWIDLSQYPNNWPELARRYPQAA